MADPGYKVVGGRELRKALKAADGNLKDMSRVHREIAAIVAPAATSRVPVWTGALRSTVKGSGTTTQARIVAGGRPKGRYVKQRRLKDGTIQRYPAKPITTVGYAWIVERRQPFIGPAIRATRPQWLAAYARHVDGIVERIGNG
jgi:hypothetical protein